MSRLRTLVSSLCLCFALLAPAAARAQAPAPSGPPAAIPLTEGWSFVADPADQGLNAGLWRGTVDAGFAPVSVPHVFDPRPLASLFGGSVGWYRLTFTGPAAAGFSWAFRFEQVRRVTQAWLNGVSIGSNSDPYGRFTLPATGLAPRRANTLVLRVDSRKDRVKPREGWWNWSGITRPVTLVPQGRVTLTNVGLMPRVTCTSAGCKASVLVDATLINRTGATATPQVTVAVRAPVSQTLSQSSVTVGPIERNRQKQVRFSLAVQGPPELWGPERPALYDAVVDAREGGAAQHVERMRIGLRSVTVRRGRLHLNGRPLQLHGASIHEDAPGHGAALTEDDMQRIVAELKALHANVTRSHYLLSDRLLSLLDEAGIMVWNQAPIFHRDRDRLLETPLQRRRALDQLRATVLGARSHPSVLVHSVANELSTVPDRKAAPRRYLKAGAALVRRLDPTTPVALDLLSYPGFPPQQTYRLFDVLGINNYFGWYPGMQGHSTERLTDLRPFLREAHARYPRQALVMTEFGAEATRDGPATQKQTFAFQARYAQRTLEIVKSLPFMGGAIYWTLREFAVKPFWNGGALKSAGPDSIHNKGLITYDGRRKPAWSTVERIFAREPNYR